LSNTNNNLENKNILFYPYIGILQFKICLNHSIKCQFLREVVKVDLVLNNTPISSTSNNSPEDSTDSNTLHFNIQLEIIPTPNRFNRILFDTYHNLYYPWDGYIPKDNIASNEDNYNYDWTMESLDTNYYQLFKSLVKENYFVEELNQPLDCVDLSLYSVLIIADNEKPFLNSEIEKLKFDFEESNISILVLSEWNSNVIESNIEFLDKDSLIRFTPNNV